MSTAHTTSQQRSSLLQKNIIASVLAKGWSAIIVFLTVPVTLRCLGEYNNGVWLTISSVMLWIDNFDIGLGNGLRNKLAIYLARGEEQRAQVAHQTLPLPCLSSSSFQLCYFCSCSSLLPTPTICSMWSWKWLTT